MTPVRQYVVVVGCGGLPCYFGRIGDQFRNRAGLSGLFGEAPLAGGFRLPTLSWNSAWTTKRNLLVCAGCQYQASLTAGTIFQDTRKPLTVWFRAIWWVTAQKNGASALGLQRISGLGSYFTAWTWLHKLRRAMVRPGRDRLGGRVEVDETYIGGSEEGKRGRRTETKALVALACEEDGEAMAASGCGGSVMPRPPACRRSSGRRSNPAVWFIPTVGKDTLDWGREDISTK